MAENVFRVGLVRVERAVRERLSVAESEGLSPQELINAKPKARRRILEEAAGISGLYQRRHEAELKLNGAESNLTRVDDVLEQLAAQLAQLARQARQASRYREIGEQLRQAEGMLLYRRWREADDARATAEAALRDCLEAEGPAVIVSQRACALLPESRREWATLTVNAAATRRRTRSECSLTTGGALGPYPG